MKIFLSWSGELSKKITTDLKDFLKTVIQASDPFFSKQDIAKGRRWTPELAKQLNDINIGIIVLTSENTKAPWILFEAGALAKNMSEGLVCTLLIDVKETDLAGPLTDFQNTKFNKDDFRQLIHDLNNLMKRPVDKNIIDSAYEKHWPDFEAKVKTNLQGNTVPKEKVRPDKEVLDEILRIVRKFQYRHIFEDTEDLSLENFSEHKYVIFNKKEEEIEFHEIGDHRIVYQIGLEQLNDTGEILDFILQVFGKGWCKPVHIYQFVECLEELTSDYFDSNAQGVFCPGGEFMQIDWDKKTKKYK